MIESQANAHPNDQMADQKVADSYADIREAVERDGFVITQVSSPDNNMLAMTTVGLSNHPTGMELTVVFKDDIVEGRAIGKRVRSFTERVGEYLMKLESKPDLDVDLKIDTDFGKYMRMAALHGLSIVSCLSTVSLKNNPTLLEIRKSVSPDDYDFEAMDIELLIELEEDHSVFPHISECRDVLDTDKPMSDLMTSKIGRFAAGDHILFGSLTSGYTYLTGGEMFVFTPTEKDGFTPERLEQLQEGIKELMLPDTKGMTQADRDSIVVSYLHRETGLDYKVNYHMRAGDSVHDFERQILQNMIMAGHDEVRVSVEQSADILISVISPVDIGSPEQKFIGMPVSAEENTMAGHDLDQLCPKTATALKDYYGVLLIREGNYMYTYGLEETHGFEMAFARPASPIQSARQMLDSVAGTILHRVMHNPDNFKNMPVTEVAAKIVAKEQPELEAGSHGLVSVEDATGNLDLDAIREFYDSMGKGDTYFVSIGVDSKLTDPREMLKSMFDMISEKVHTKH